MRHVIKLLVTINGLEGEAEVHLESSDPYLLKGVDPDSIAKRLAFALVGATDEDEGVESAKVLS